MVTNDNTDSEFVILNMFELFKLKITKSGSVLNLKIDYFFE
jgi:hypothetical protein